MKILTNYAWIITFLMLLVPVIFSFYVVLLYKKEKNKEKLINMFENWYDFFNFILIVMSILIYAWCCNFSYIVVAIVNFLFLVRAFKILTLILKVDIFLTDIIFTGIFSLVMVFAIYRICNYVLFKKNIPLSLVCIIILLLSRHFICNINVPIRIIKSFLLKEREFVDYFVKVYRFSVYTSLLFVVVVQGNKYIQSYNEFIVLLIPILISFCDYDNIQDLFFILKFQMFSKLLFQ